MNKRFTILILLMAFFVPWAAKAQETKTIQVAPDRGGDRATMTVYKRVSSITSGRNYLIVNSATSNSDARALSQTAQTVSSITASYVHINSGISGTGNAVYIADLADPTAVWTANGSSTWTFSHYNNGSTYYIYTDRNTLSASTSSINWTYNNNNLYYHYTTWVIFSTDYYITPSASGFSLSEDAANVYLFEQTDVTAYDVTTEVSPAGIGRVTGAGQYPAGATCTLTASTFNSEYAFSNWTVNGSVVSTSPTYSFTVNADQNVVANFEPTVPCPAPVNLTAGTIYGHSIQLDWTSEADNFNVRYRTIGSGETQTFFDGFENGLGNWTIIRNGEGTENTDWSQSDASNWGSTHSGSYVAQTRSWNTNAYSVDNWLITPQVTLDGTLKFWVLDDGTYHEHYDVYVSTTGNSTSDFSLFYEPGNATNTWTEVTVDLSSFNSARGYIALRHTDTDKNWMFIDDFGIYAERYGDWSQLIPASETPFTLTGLESQTDYQVQVQANCGNDLSGWSSRLNFTTTAPSTAAPTNLTVDVNSIRSNRATVSWQGVAANDSHQYYEVYYAESNVTSVPDSPAAPNLIDSITETSYTILGLTPETEYHVWVRDYCGEDGYSAWTPYITFTTIESCLMPTNVTVSDITAHNATIAWVDDSDSHLYYQVYYAESNVTSVPDSIAAPNLIDSISETAYTLSGLRPETEYHVWVRDYCGDDDYSAWSSYQTFTTLVSCPAPTGLAVVENSIYGHGATVSWDRVATEETGLVTFNYVCIASGDTLNWDDASIFIDDADNPNPPTVNLTDLDPETEYTFYLRKDCAEEGFSTVVMVSFTTDIACPAPTGLIVVENSVTGHTATVSWTNASYGHHYYQVYYAESDITSVPDSIAAPNLIDSISTMSYTLTGLHSETEYHVWVRAYCGDYDGYSAWTSYQTFTTLVSCFPPTDVTITNETGHGATIEWNGTSDSYLVMVGEAEPSTTYSYDFEDGTSQGWTLLKGNEGTSPNNWMHSSLYSAYDSNQALIVPVCHNSSSGMMLSESYISAATSGGTPYGAVTPDNYLVSPQIRLGGSITFYAASRMSNYPAEKFSVMVSESGNTSISDFTHTELTVTLSDNEWHEYTVDLSAYSGMGYVAIRHYDCYDQHLLYIDDITIVSGSTATTWMTYEAEESPFTLYDVANIRPETTYSVQVIGVCDGEESRPSAATNFTTTIACPAPTGLAIVENSITGHGATFEWEGNSDTYKLMYRNAITAPIEMNDTYDFEDQTLQGWTSYDEDGDGYGWTNVSTPHGGSRGLQARYNSNAVPNNWLISPEIPLGGTISFYAKNSSSLTEQFQVYVSTTGTNISDFTPISGLETPESSYTPYEYNLSSYSGNGYVAIKHTAAVDKYWLYVDDITITNSIAGEYGEWQTVAADSIPFTLTGLTPETFYEVVVQSDCGEDGLSSMSNSVTFTTEVACMPPTNLHATDVTAHEAVLNWDGDAESYNVNYYKAFFFESFEEDLSQWTVYKNGDESSMEWGIENPHDNSSDLSAHSGYFAAVAYSDFDVHSDSWLISPQIQFPNQTTLKFWIMRSTYDDALDEYEVRLSTTDTDTASFNIVLKEKTVANSTWTEVSIPLNDYDGQLCYIAIRHDYTDGFFIMVDDFGIFGWSEDIVTTDNSLAIDDLLPETEYLWQVQANCGDEDGLSQWSDISTFTTLKACPIPFNLSASDETAYGATLTWTGLSDSYNVWVGQLDMDSIGYDFESNSINADFTNNSDYPWSVTSNDKHAGTYSVKSGGAATNDATSDLKLEVTVEHDATLSFWACISSEASYDKGYFSIDGSIKINGISGDGSWINYSYPLEAGTHTLRWYYSKDTSVNSYDDCFYVDDISIESVVILSEMNYTATESPFLLVDATNILPETTYLVKVKGFCDDEATEFSEDNTFTTRDESTKIFVFEGDWSDGNNWVPVGVPTIEEDAILRAEATAFDVAEANIITIENDATLIIEDGGQLKTNADVTATMKRFIIGYGTDYVETDQGYYLMALPTANPISAADAGLITEESDYDLYSWNRTATDEEWQNNHDGIDLQNGIGFLYSNRDDMEMSFTATLRNSSEPVVVTPSYDDVEHGGWNLYGNPFPCEAYITTDAEGMTFYRLVDNVLVPVEGAIAPLEAFFVKATAAEQTFTISREVPEER